MTLTDTQIERFADRVAKKVAPATGDAVKTGVIEAAKQERRANSLNQKIN